MLGECAGVGVAQGDRGVKATVPSTPNLAEVSAGEVVHHHGAMCCVISLINLLVFGHFAL